MFKTMAIGAALIATPAAATTFSRVEVENSLAFVYDADATKVFSDNGSLQFAQALNVTGNLVTAFLSGNSYGAAYASTRYEYTAPLDRAQQVDFDASGYINRLAMGHALAIIAAWQENSLGALQWSDIYQFDTCTACAQTGYTQFSAGWSRLAQPGDRLFLTITAQNYSDDAPSDTYDPDYVPSAASFRQAQSYVTRRVTIAEVTAAPGVPEPGSWAMLIAGFGIAGAAQRRRRVLAA